MMNRNPNQKIEAEDGSDMEGRAIDQMNTGRTVKKGNEENAKCEPTESNRGTQTGSFHQELPSHESHENDSKDKCELSLESKSSEKIRTSKIAEEEELDDCPYSSFESSLDSVASDILDPIPTKVGWRNETANIQENDTYKKDFPSAGHDISKSFESGSSKQNYIPAKVNIESSLKKRGQLVAGQNINEAYMNFPSTLQHGVKPRNPRDLEAVVSFAPSTTTRSQISRRPTKRKRPTTEPDHDPLISVISDGQDSGPSDGRYYPWMDKYIELCLFHDKFHHSNVPKSYEKENPALVQWIERQRHEYQLRQEGKPSILTAARVNALERLGFSWDL